MNLGELKSRVKRQFGDESGVQVVDDDIVRWANDAQREIVMQNETVLQDVELQNIGADQDTYNFPADLLILRSIRIKTKDNDPYEAIPGYSLTQFDASISTWDSNIGRDTPKIYTTYEQQIFLFPKPRISYTNGLKILYSKVPVDVSGDSDVFSLPLMYHNAILKYCLIQAYEMDEDWEGSSNKLAQFQNDLNINAEKENRGARETYPTITVLADDSSWW